MAVTVAVARQTVSPGAVRSYGTITFDSSYLPGGEPVVANNFKLGAGDFELLVHPTAGYTFAYDRTAKTVIAYRSASHTHVLHFQTAAAANAVTAASNQLRTAAAAFDVAGVADATGEGGIVTAAQSALAEVSSGVDLSAVVARYEAVGAY